MALDWPINREGLKSGVGGYKWNEKGLGKSYSDVD